MSSLNHPHPGQILMEDVVKPLNLSVNEAAKKFGMPPNYFSLVLNGKVGISSDLAIRLEMNGISTARFWVALQSEYDLEQTKKHKRPTTPRFVKDLSCD